MSIEELKQTVTNATDNLYTAHEALKQAHADRTTAIAAHASGDTSAKLDAADRAITAASRAVEIAETGLAPAREALAAAEAAANAAETEQLRDVLKALHNAADAAADVIDSRVSEANAATTTYAEAMHKVAAFRVQHAERLRLPIMGMPQHLKVELHLPPAGDIPRRVGKVPRMNW